MRGSDRFGGRDRGVSAVIGFILIFGILVISFSMYQATVVPQQNADAEFEQYQEVQEQMVDLRNTVVSMYDSTSSGSTAVDLGVRYPSRTVFVNPAPASARLQTEGTGDPGINMTVQNARATDSEGAGETANFWNGTDRVYETGSIEYRPDYNRFQGAQRIVYEHGLVYNQVEAGGRSVPLTQQPLIQDDRVSFVALNGSLQEGGTGTRSVDFEPLSTRSRVVEVNNTGGPITLEFASKMDASVWNETFEDQLVGNGGHVESVGFSREGPDGFDIIAVTLESDQRYELELTKVGVGTGTTATTEQYLTAVEGANAVVQSGSTQRLTVEARDNFNTPKSGVQVEADPSGGAFLNSTNVTGPDGQATFLYEAQTSGTHRVNFTIDPGYEPDDSHNPSTATNVSMRVVVPATSSGSGGGGSTYDVTWEDPATQSGVTYDPSTDRYEYDASIADEITLTMFTNPVVDGATVNYAVSNRSRATVNPDTSKTSPDGTSSTQLRPEGTGVVTVYTTSGDDGDTLRFNITNFDPGAPSVSNFAATNPSGQDVQVSFDSDEELSTISVDLSGPESATLTRSEFTESESGGTYTYTATYNGNSDGTYTATLNTAEDSDGNDGASGQSDMVTVSGSILGGDETILYQKTNGNVAGISGDGGTVQTLGPSGVDALGPIGEDLDGDGAPELAYVDNGNLNITDSQGNVNKLVDSSDTGAPRTSKALMATETWNRSGPSVFYADSGSDKVYRTNASTSSPVEVADPGNGANAVLDTGDIDGDGSDELVFLDGSQSVRYLNQDGSIDNLANAGAGASSGVGAGELITINGKVWTTLVDGSNNIKLVTDDGGNEVRTIKPAQTPGGKKGTAKSPITSADVDDDGSSEIVYLRNGNNKLRYVDDPLGPAEGIKQLTNSNGAEIKADSAIGVVSG